MGWDQTTTTEALYDAYVRTLFGSVLNIEDKQGQWNPVVQDRIAGHFRPENNLEVPLASSSANVFDFGVLRASMHAYNSSMASSKGPGAGRVAGKGHQEGVNYVKGPWWWAFKKISMPDGMNRILDDPAYMAYRNPLLGFEDEENKFSTTSMWQAFAEADNKKNIGMMGALEAIEKDVAFKEGASSLPDMFGESTEGYFKNMASMILDSEEMLKAITTRLGEAYLGEGDPYEEITVDTGIEDVEPISFVGSNDTVAVLATDAFDVSDDAIGSAPEVDFGEGLTLSNITHPDIDNISSTGATTGKSVAAPKAITLAKPEVISPHLPETDLEDVEIDDTPIDYQVEAIYFTGNRYRYIQPPSDIDPDSIESSTVITTTPVPKGSITVPITEDAIFIGDIDDLSFEDITAVAAMVQPLTQDAVATALVPPVLDPDLVYEPEVPEDADYGEVELPDTEAQAYEIDMDSSLPEDYLPDGYSPIVADEIILSKGKVLPGVIDLAAYDAILRADVDAAVSALRDSLTLRYSEEESNMRRSLALGRRGLSTHFDRAQAILTANKEAQINQYEQELVIEAMKTNAGLASTAADFETRANIASAENYLRTLLGYAENGVRLIVTQFEGWIRAALQNADLQTRVSMTNYENAVRAAIASAENLTRMSAAVLEAGTSIERVIAENSLRAQISKTEIALQAASTIAQLGTQVAMANKDAYNKASLAFAENSLRAALTTTESRVRVALALQEDISRVSLANHDAATQVVLAKLDADMRSDIASAENALRAAVSNREITSSENIAGADNLLKAALASYDGRIRTIVANAENKTRIAIGNQDARIRAGELAVREGVAKLETEFRRLVANQEAYLRIGLGQQETWARVLVSELDTDVRAQIAHAEAKARAETAVLDADVRLAIASAENATRAALAKGEGLIRLQVGKQEVLIKAALAEYEGKIRAAFENHGAELKVALSNQETALKAALANQDAMLRFDLAYRDSMLKARLSTQDVAARTAIQDKEIVLKTLLADQDIRHKYDAMEQQRLFDDITLRQDLGKILYDVYLGWMRSYESHLGMVGSMVAEGMRKHTAELASDREMLIKSETLRWDVMQQRAAFIEGLAGLKWQSQLQNMSVMQQASAALGKATGVRETPSQFTRNMQKAGFLMDAIGGLAGLITAIL